MTYPYPKLIVTVKTYDPATFVSTLPPDSNIDNIKRQLENVTVWIPTWPYPLKHGDQFTVYGKQAIYIYNLINQYNENNNVSLEVEYYGNVISPEVDRSGSVVFINTDYVDYNLGDIDAEASNITAYFDDIGRDYITFTDISAEGFTTALDGKKNLLMPENEYDDLILSGEAEAVIEDFVNTGGNLIIFKAENEYLGIINSAFGMSIGSYGEGGGDIEKQPAASTTIFSDCASTLPDLSATSAVNATTLPEDGIAVYKSQFTDASYVTLIPYGSGNIILLGWDWYNAQPVGSEDGGWLQVLFNATAE
jgi:hypothetical protein